MSAHITHAKRTQFRVAPGGEIEALAMPEADSETSLARRGSGLVQLPDLRGCQERGGWGRAGNSERAPSAPAADLGASPFGRRPQAPLSCDLRLNHAQDQKRPGRPGWLPTQVSGKEVTSPPPPPLRTARESFPSCSSSLSNALRRTRLSHI